ncbi:hypothetical protein VZT92_021330 [Zoarces viviparus]|uniref:Uncharacterized protein n=1 Tax=Zoarces viviparus TaxID=48416 RepID=A0AAW1EDH0_ZOAVI
MRPAGASRTGQRSHEGIPTHPSTVPIPAELNPPRRLRGPHPFTSQRFHALLNSLFKVLFNFPLRPDPGATGAVTGLTVHGMSLDQKDSGPRATPGKRSSIRHMSPIRPSDGDSALGSSLFARRY